MRGHKKYDFNDYKIPKGIEGNIEKLSNFRPIYTHKNWNKDIKKMLIDIKDKAFTLEEIVLALNIFRTQYSVNRLVSYKRQPEQYTFKVLLTFYQKYILELFSKISLFILKRNDINIPIFNASINQDKQISKDSIFYIICCMVFCLIPIQESDFNEHNRKGFNFMTHFSEILSTNEFKTRCIMEYLLDEIDLMLAGKLAQPLCIIRNKCGLSMKELLYKKGLQRMRKISMETNSDIERHNDKMKISFANRYIGGGALGKGLVQEEIMFATHPELHAAIILCQSFQDDETLCFKGFKRYFLSDGYRQSIKFMGRINQNSKLGYMNEQKQCIVSIDAINFSSNSDKQYDQRFIDRQIIKAYTGFSCQERYREIATGNWGCGAFSGNPELKFMIQWIAASLASKDLTYCAVGNKTININVPAIYKGSTIEEVYHAVVNGGLKMRKTYFKQNFFNCLVD